ncbi:hypothetical protein C3L33_07599, partial [Rhododendron williamsianum]
MMERRWRSRRCGWTWRLTSLIRRVRSWVSACYQADDWGDGRCGAVQEKEAKLVQVLDIYEVRLAQSKYWAETTSPWWICTTSLAFIPFGQVPAFEDGDMTLFGGGQPVRPGCFKAGLGACYQADLWDDNGRSSGGGAGGQTGSSFGHIRGSIGSIQVLGWRRLHLGGSAPLPNIHYLMGTQVKKLFDSRPHVNAWCPISWLGQLGLRVKAINPYIAHAYEDKGTQLIYHGKMAILSMGMQVEANQFDPDASKLVWELLVKLILGMTTDAAVVEVKEAKLGQVLDIYEVRLGQSKYLGGDNFTLVDLHHLPCIQYLMGTQVKKLFDSAPMSALGAPISWLGQLGLRFLQCNPTISLQLLCNLGK